MSLHFHRWGKWVTFDRRVFNAPAIGSRWFIFYQRRVCDRCGREQVKARESDG